MSAPEPRWTPICDLQRIPVGGMHPVAAEGHKLVVVRPDASSVRVLDNRCPHEGYPLSQGQLEGGMLTCCWHNWKFRVDDGACVLGGENARTWPARIVGDAVQADLAEPDPAELIPGLLDSLQVGLFEHDVGRGLRDGVRLLKLGLSPRRLLAELAAYDARHSEYGSSHVMALAADCARGLPDDAGPAAMYSIAPVIELCGESNCRLPARERAAPAAVDLSGEGSARLGVELRAAVQAKDVDRAQALLAGALDEGADWAVVERWLLEIASDHFTDFGHQLIYLTKTRDLLAGLDDPEVLAALTRDVALGQLDGMLYATREDTLPYMERYSKRLEAIQAELPELLARGRDDIELDGTGLRDAVLDGSAVEAIDALHAALCEGVAAPRIARELVAAAAHRLLRFDVSLDSDPDCMEGWLWATHRFTFAAAVRQAVEQLPTPDALRFLYHAVAFVHSGRPMDVEQSQQIVLDGSATTEPNEPTVDDVLTAIAAKHADHAVLLAQALLASDEGVQALRIALEQLCLADPLVRPIVVTHAIKTTWAAFEEHALLAGHVDRNIPILATVRLLASPIVERRVHEMVTRSIDWVVNGKVPRKLTQ